MIEINEDQASCFMRAEKRRLELHSLMKEIFGLSIDGLQSTLYYLRRNTMDAVTRLPLTHREIYRVSNTPATSCVTGDFLLPSPALNAHHNENSRTQLQRAAELPSSKTEG